MLHIILLILKIIGLILAVILGLILAAVLLILLVPLRYRAYVGKKEDFIIKADVGWLFRLLHIRFVYEGSLLVQARILGFLIFSTEEEWKVQREKKMAARQKKNEEKQKKKAAKAGSAADADSGVQGSGSEEAGESSSIKKEQQSEMAEGKALEDGKSSAAEKAPKPEESSGEADTFAAPESMNVKAVEDRKPHEGALPETMEEDSGDSSGSGEVQKQPGRLMSAVKSISEKIKAFIGLIKNVAATLKVVLAKLKAVFKGIWDSLRKGREGIGELGRKISVIRTFLTDASHKSAFGHVFGIAKKILIHVLPCKIRGSLTIGTGDPCSTGQLLGLLSLLYAKTGGSFTVTPDFDEAKYEGELVLKGRIRAGTLFILLLRIIGNSGVRALIKDGKKLPEALKRPAEA